LIDDVWNKLTKEGVMHIEWWYWIIFGILLLLAEAATPGGFYLLFVGIAALVVGALTPLIQISWVELSVFAVLSVLLIVFFRHPLVERVRKATPHADVKEFIGESARVIDAIPAGREGKVELRGSVWRAKNNGLTDLSADELCTITALQGIMVIVKSK
jgi:inner membrane protein